MAESRTLALLLEQAERARDQALVAFQQAELRLRQAQAQHKGLGQYQSEYDARWMAQFRTEGAAAVVLQAHHQFGNRLIDAIGQQSQLTGVLESRLRAARQQLRERELRVASVRKLIERRQAEHHERQRRAEQKTQDEFGTLRRQSLLGAEPP